MARKCNVYIGFPRSQKLKIWRMMIAECILCHQLGPISNLKWIQ
uniref:Uncharacterized protein n=1 Tax=Strigamia maritima TaxID=126957 RepID=T1JKN3_STRMM